MKAVASIAFLYIIFAGFASIANLTAQAFVAWACEGPYAVEASLAIGTAIGAIVRYVFVKCKIFSFQSESLRHDGKLFIKYSFFGFFTTVLFWTVEIAFERIFGTNSMRYLGGAIGLIVGYVVKYYLDKRFVFVNKSTTQIGAA